MLSFTELTNFTEFYSDLLDLLSFTENTVLYSVIQRILSQMEEHERALDLLTHKLKDYRGAEDYCATYSQVSPHSQTLSQPLVYQCYGIHLSINQVPERMKDRRTNSH